MSYHVANRLHEHLIQHNNKRHCNRRINLRLHQQTKHISTKRHTSHSLFPLNLRHTLPLIIVNRTTPLRVRSFNLVDHPLCFGSRAAHVSQRLRV
ncbi:hypothetical protein Hanom_Chr00s006707g01735411 [Helianthus anomalus]